MLAIIVPIIVSWYVYKTARENGRNGLIWGLINFAVFFGSQLLLGLAIGVIIGLGIGLFEWDENTFEVVFDKWGLLLNFAGFAVGGFGSWLIVRHVTRVPEERFYPQPPPPPSFN